MVMGWFCIWLALGCFQPCILAFSNFYSIKVIIVLPDNSTKEALIIAFILGANGNRYAWDKYDGTPEQFDDKQRKWKVAAFIVLGISVLGTIITIIVLSVTGAALLSGF